MRPEPITVGQRVDLDHVGAEVGKELRPEGTGHRESQSTTRTPSSGGAWRVRAGAGVRAGRGDADSAITSCVCAPAMPAVTEDRTGHAERA